MTRYGYRFGISVNYRTRVRVEPTLAAARTAAQLDRLAGYSTGRIQREDSGGSLAADMRHVPGVRGVAVVA